MNKKTISTIVFVFIGFVLFLILTSSTFLTIEPGERGVIFRPFGTGLDKENLFQPGFHVIAPWNKMYIYDVRENQIEEEMEVLSSNGLNIKVDVTVRVHPDFDKIGDLHENFGVDYLNSLVRPEVRSAVRQVIGRFQPEELYSSKREEVQSSIHKDIQENLGKNFVVLRATLIRDIALPDRVKDAIEEKIQSEQLALKYVYILQQERSEAERKIIEAEAKSKSNTILNASLTDKILKDKGIEATLQLANSPNTKVIVVGGNGDGLPLILGGN
ncbi:MAG: prohibitin family protein [Lewinellaceae bacterium]|nr:prohibitin family protein [Saprospiraceae bacterium]MCB9338682.1 prohibitin family protein [Lewinellaceae bacterium]